MSFVAWANAGPWTNNTGPPFINATYLNNIDSFLDQITSSVVADANITANGSGNMVVGGGLTVNGAGTALSIAHNATVSGTLTSTGNHVANGGMNTNTIRDATNGNTGMDLSAGSGLVKFPHGLSLIVGSLSRIWISGALAIASGGTSVSHGLGVTPDFVIGTLDEGAAGTNVIGIAYGSMSSSSFTAYASGGPANCRFLAIKL